MDINIGAPGGLICPASVIFDGEAVQARIAEACADVSDALEIRASIAKEVGAARKAGLAQIAEAFAERPFAAHGTTRAYAWLAEACVTTIFESVKHYIHPLAVPTDGERLALVAVGGFGRGEMALHSDIDLLFLTPYKITPWAESVIESTLYTLWDLRLKIGHASRSVEDCMRFAREDMTVRTSLLEMRGIAGDATLTDLLSDRLREELFASTTKEFITAKLDERSARHRKQGGQRYMVEPNVKEGKGGLRDLQSLFWIEKYVYDVSDTADLVRRGVLTASEYETFESAEEFLWAVRCHLHIIANRPSDQLTFDMQVEVAARMGYVDRAGRRAVEHFMQDYFRHATQVGDLTRICLTSLEAARMKTAPTLTGLIKSRRVKAPFSMRQKRVTVKTENVFEADPVNILRIFAEALRTGTLLHPDAMRMVSANLDLIDHSVQTSPAAAKTFIDILLKYGNPERGLRRMNELGVLAAYIPEFAPVVAMMQFNMYHHYTVDEHTIQCIMHLAQIEQGALVEELPVASAIIDGGINRRVLYIALLLHDIGKGRPEDHSILGAQISRSVAPRLGLTKDECELVEWLVRNHLLMSDVAQKRDIAEPRTVRDFAKAVQSKERLDLLLVLTVCDIMGVGPNTWNNWKAVLLRNLHEATAQALETGVEDLNRKTRENVAKKALREALADWSAKDLRVETNRHYGPYWQGLPPQTHVVFAHMLRDLGDDEFRLDLQPDIDRDATRVCIAMADHPGLFSRMTGALALVGANVVDARTYTSKDGYATAVFWVQDADGAPYETARLPRLRKMIDRTLKGDVITRDAIQERDKIKKRERAFRRSTSVTFDNDGSEIYTIIEVDTRDRPGLLFDLTQTLANASVYIASAVIATYGEQVVDTFYVKDAFGLKFHSEQKQEALRQKLIEAIEKGRERAHS